MARSWELPFTTIIPFSSFSSSPRRSSEEEKQSSVCVTDWGDCLFGNDSDTASSDIHSPTGSPTPQISQRLRVDVQALGQGWVMGRAVSELYLSSFPLFCLSWSELRSSSSTLFFAPTTHLYPGCPWRNLCAREVWCGNCCYHHFPAPIWPRHTLAPIFSHSFWKGTSFGP